MMRSVAVATSGEQDLISYKWFYRQVRADLDKPETSGMITKDIASGDGYLALALSNAMMVSGLGSEPDHVAERRPGMSDTLLKVRGLKIGATIYPPGEKARDIEIVDTDRYSMEEIGQRLLGKLG